MNKIAIIIFFILSHHALGKKIRVGIASNFSKISSSASNPYGNYFRDAIYLALSQKKKNLKKKNIEIELVEFDYGDSKLAVLKSANNACASDVSVVIGYGFSSHALLAAPIHEKCKLSMITPTATADSLSKFEKYVHRGSFDNAYQGETLAKLVKSWNKKSKAIIISIADCAYCQDLAKAFETQYSKLGGETLKHYRTLDNEKDIQKLVSKLEKNSFDVVVVPNHELVSASILEAVSREHPNAVFLGGDGWGDIGQQIKSVVKERHIKRYWVTHWLKAINTKKINGFIKAYQKMFMKSPNETSALTYDSMNILINAIMNSKNHSRKSIENSLKKIKFHNGVTGDFIFRSKRAPKKSIVLLENHLGTNRLVKIINPTKSIP